MTKVVQAAFLVALSALLLLKAYSTLGWRMEHDTPLLHYVAFLMDQHGLVVYRDIFETSMPVTFAFHYLIGKLFGYGDLAFRIVDLTLLGALLVATYMFMLRFGRLVGACSAVLFGLVYLSHDQTMSLQRDYIGVIPVAFSLLCIPRHAGARVGLGRFALLGLLFGLSVLIKPHLGIALPIIFGTLLAFRRHFQAKSVQDFVICALVTVGALLVPVSIALVWLAAHSALAPFADVVFNYLPLHSTMTGAQETLSGRARLIYIVSQTSVFGGFGALLLCSVLAYYCVLTTERGRTTTLSLICLALCMIAYAIYPAIAGKFWRYHWMPFVYFASISAGLCFMDRSAPRALVALLAVAIVVLVQLPLRDYVLTLNYDLRAGARSPNNGRVDEIAAWLKSNLRPGDRVQPLDWTAGSVHAMLLAKARLATRFMYDYHFYHHVSSPYIQQLRRSFISELREAAPRFVVEIVSKDKPFVSGKDTTQEFPELRQILSERYRVAHSGEGYLIYERISGEDRMTNPLEGNAWLYGT